MKIIYSLTVCAATEHKNYFFFRVSEEKKPKWLHRSFFFSSMLLLVKNCKYFTRNVIFFYLLDFSRNSRSIIKCQITFFFLASHVQIVSGNSESNVRLARIDMKSHLMMAKVCYLSMRKIKKIATGAINRISLLIFSSACLFIALQFCTHRRHSLICSRMLVNTKKKKKEAKKIPSTFTETRGFICTWGGKIEK